MFLACSLVGVGAGKCVANRSWIRLYSVKNILRNRYRHRNKDGSFKDYNESITLLPEEFKHQGTFF